MPAHDWTRVSAGVFHDFHLAWLAELRRALNGGLLPPGYYAMAEQVAGGVGPDVIALEAPPHEGPAGHERPTGGVAIASRPPKTEFHARAEGDIYAAKAKALVIRHSSDHRIVAMIEIVSPGNKNSRGPLRAFVEKAAGVIRAGIHLLIVDLFPPGPRDPQGVQRAIWDELTDNNITLPEGRPLTAAAYIGGPIPEAFIEPFAVGSVLPEMPLFLTTDEYVPVPLEATYMLAWGPVPAFWREVLEGNRPAGPSA
jgi:hypothetical protein